MNKYLIVGLGNIGMQYALTRHNIGFLILDFLSKSKEISFTSKKLGDIASFKIKGKTVYLLKPNTFMNLSGKSVNYWMKELKIPLENLLIINDDIHLPFGKLRLKSKGSHAGHNGLKDIEDKLNTKEYNRLKFGVGNNFHKGKQADYVLSNWKDKEFEELKFILNDCTEIIKSFVLQGTKNTMNLFNKK